MFGIFKRLRALEERVEKLDMDLACLEVSTSGETMFHNWIEPYLAAELRRQEPKKKRGRPRKK